MQKILLLAAVLSFGLAARSNAAAPPSPNPLPQGGEGRVRGAASPSVERLIEQLGDSDFRKRDQASAQLEALGLKVVPALKKALGHRDAEVRRRALELIPQLETAAFVAPRRVTFTITNKPLRAVFDEITKQTGYKIEFWANNTNRTYSFEFKDLPFWQALDRICQEANLVVQQNYGDERVVLQQQNGHVQHVRYEGAFRFVPTGFQMFRNVNFGLAGGANASTQRSESLTLNFMVFSEPRIPLLGMGEVRVTAAYDNDKNSMLVPAAAPGDIMNMNMRWAMRRGFSSRYGNGNRSYWMQSQFNLNRPSERATRLKVVRGTIPITLLVEQTPVVVADKVLTAKGKKSTVGTTTFYFEDVTAPVAKQCQIKLSVTEDVKDNPNDYTWMNTLYNRIELQDDKGKKFQITGSSWGNSGGNQVQMTLTYVPQGNMGPPSKFVFQKWTTLQHQINFEFRDLPLP